MTAPGAARFRGGRRLLAGLLLAVSAACSDDPSGPGTVELVVRGPAALGAAVVQITGAGVTGVESVVAGWVELVPAAPVGSTPVHRLVLVQDEPGELRVRLKVADVSAALPAVSVVEASDRFDLPVATPSSVEAVVRR